MSHKMHSGEMTPAEALAAARDLGRDADTADGIDTSYESGREIVREFVAQMDIGEVAHVRARRVLVTASDRIATPGNVKEPSMGRPEPTETQAVGRTLAAHARGDTADDYLPHVDVSRWKDVCEGGPTTWTIEVVGDE